MGFLDVAFYTFIVVVFIQVLIYVFLFGKFAFSKHKKIAPKNIPISVIIYAKNEAKNLKSVLPLVIEQDYPNFEIVLINDGAHNKTLKVMQYFEKRYKNIKIVNVKPVEAFWGNKKYALTLGIKASKNDYLLFTDAKCKPLSNQWIRQMTSTFNNDKSLVLGYSAYSKIKKSFLNKLIRFDTLVTAVHYFSFAKIGMPYMGVGKNLAYTKKEFYLANGFINHIKVRSGDDNLFVNQVANNHNTGVCFSKESFTESIPKSTFKEWIKQEKHQFSTVRFYKLHHKIWLTFIYATPYLFWFLAITLLITTFSWQIVVSLFLLRIILLYIVFGNSAKKLEENDLLVILPFLEIFLVFTQLSIFINNMISKPNYWK